MESNAINELGQLFEQEAGALVLYARQWLECHAAEDAVQDAFIDLVNCRRPPPHPKPWLYRAVRYRALKSLRTDRRRGRREARVTEEAESLIEGGPADAIDAHEAGQALAGLPPEDREIITLRIWGGLTLDQIAGITESSVATVFRRYRAGLDQLRQRLEPTCKTSPH